MFKQLLGMFIAQGLLVILGGLFIGAAIGMLYFFQEKWTARMGCVVCALISVFFICLAAYYLPRGQMNTFVVVYGVPLIIIQIFVASLDLLLIETTAKITFYAMRHQSPYE